MSEKTTGETLIGTTLERAVDEIDGFQTDFATEECDHDDADTCPACGGSLTESLIEKAVGVMEAVSIILLTDKCANPREARLLGGIVAALANLEVGEVDSAVRAYQRYRDRSGKADENGGEDQDAAKRQSEELQDYARVKAQQRRD